MNASTWPRTDSNSSISGHVGGDLSMVAIMSSCIFCQCNNRSRKRESNTNECMVFHLEDLTSDYRTRAKGEEIEGKQSGKERNFRIPIRTPGIEKLALQKSKIRWNF